MPGAAPCLLCSLRWHGFVALGMGGCEWCLSAKRMAVTEDVTWESLAKRPGGDRDRPYDFGNPSAGLTTVEQGKLLVMRGYMRDVRHWHPPLVLPADTAAAGDMGDWVKPTESGLLVPVEPQPWIGQYWHDDPEAP